MFCPKCGANLDEKFEFCSNCGADLKESKELRNREQAIKNREKNKEALKQKIEKIKSFFRKNKKKIIIGFSGLIIILILFFGYKALFGFEKLKWDKEYEHYKLDYITQGKIKLGFDFSDLAKLDQIKVKTTCGTTKVSGLKIDWDLTEALGKCKIEVSYKLKKIIKTITVINPSANTTELSLDYQIDYESDEDLDLDGMTNKEEKGYGTNPELYDTDMDGLDDYYEIFISKTDPLKKDTDMDGLNDYDEIELGLDPLKEDSLGDGIKDGNRKNSYTIQDEDLGIILEVTGTGNVASSTINTFKNPTFEKMNGLLDTVYNFYTSGTLENAKVTIPYTIEEITQKGLNEDNLTLYYFNETTKQLEAIPTTIDKENKNITVTLSHFSKYVLGDSDVVLTSVNNQIMLVIDNSVSMYTYDQLTELGYVDITGADGNDSSFKRLSLTNKLIDMFTGNYYFGVSEFAGNYINLLKFSNDQTAAKKAVNSIENDVEDIGNGTNIVSALNKGIKEFSNDENEHYLILLTDGKDTSTYNTLSSNKTSIISSAKAKNIKICIIGLGSNIDTDDLNTIAEGTGCDYYNANDAGALDEIYSIIGADINYNLVDTNDDGITNGTLIADSGFIVTRDGFSFDNYGTNLSPGGHCFGMATFAELNYVNKLPLTLGSKTVKKQKSYAYNLENTYFSQGKNLYDFKLQSNSLKYTFPSIFDFTVPVDFRVIEKKDLVINDIYKKELNRYGLYSIIREKSMLDKEGQIKKYGATYNECETPYLNEEYMQNNNNITNDEVQLFNAIYAMFIKQNDQTFYSSSSNVILALRNILGTEDDQKIDSATFINLLKNRLENGDVPVISSNYNNGLHAINAISLVQDNIDANHYYIGVYDNNYPGEKRYVDIECNKKTCVTKANNFYKSTNQPIRITPSLEYDLEYFK